MAILIVVATLALVVGLTLGLLGGGGSILTLPILVYLLDMDTTTGIAVSLFVVASTSMFAVVQHAREGNVDWKVGGVFGAAGMAGAYLGGRLAVHIHDTVLLVLFAVIMLATGAMMFRGKKGAVEACPSDEGEACLGDSAERAKEKLPVLKILVEGLSVGVLTGMVGAGGGFLVVPALAMLGGLTMKRAIGTSLMIIALKSWAGFAGVAPSVDIPWALTLTFTLSAIVGSLVGVRLLTRMAPDKLRAGFAGFVLLMAGVILVQEVGMDLLALAAADISALWAIPLALVSLGSGYLLGHKRGRNDCMASRVS